MKKVKIKNRNYKVIPEAGLVIGEMKKKSIIDETDDLNKLQKDILLSAIGVYNWLPFDNDNDNIHANAYCDERDEFDEKIGIDVCTEKLYLKQHQQMLKQYEKAMKNLEYLADWIYGKAQMHVEKINSIKDDLVRMYGRGQV